MKTSQSKYDTEKKGFLIYKNHFYDQNRAILDVRLNDICIKNSYFFKSSLFATLAPKKSKKNQNKLLVFFQDIPILRRIEKIYGLCLK